MLGLVRSAASVVGPALAGVLIAVTSPAVVIAIDAGSYGASVLALSLLAIPAVGSATQSPWRDLADGWRQFRAVTWLWLTTLQFALFNLFTWAPYLLLGPIMAREFLGGASAWGAIMAAFAGGSVLGGMLAIGRKPRRPLVIATAATFGYSLPCLLLAVHAPAIAVAGGALAAGAGGAVSATFSSTVVQQRVPRDMLARISAFETTGAFALGSVGFVLVGPVAALVGPDKLLAFGAGYSILSSAVMLALPTIWSVRSLDPGAGRSRASGRSVPRGPGAPTVGCRSGSVGSAETQREGRSA